MVGKYWLTEFFFTAFPFLCNQSPETATQRLVEEHKETYMHSFIWPTYFSFLAESNYWQHIGLSELKYKLNKPLIKGEAKNVIMFLGDGMSLTTITSARIYKGQKKSNAATDPIGEKAHLAFENFPFTGLAKVRFWLSSIGWNYQNIDLKCKVTIGQGPLSTNWPSSHEYDAVVNKRGRSRVRFRVVTWNLSLCLDNGLPREGN